MKMAGRNIMRSPQLILHTYIVGKNSDIKPCIFENIVKASVDILPGFDPRSVANIIYACGLAEYISKMYDWSPLLDLLAE